jgi:hypothetical protein
VSELTDPDAEAFEDYDEPAHREPVAEQFDEE